MLPIARVVTKDMTHLYQPFPSDDIDIALLKRESPAKKVSLMTLASVRLNTPPRPPLPPSTTDGKNRTLVVAPKALKSA
jgi:hypothetical protein